MDLITFLNVAASVVTIIAFGLEIFSKNSSNAQTLINISITDERTPNYPTPPTYTPEKTNSISDSLIISIIVFFIIGGIICKFYLSNQSTIILCIVITGIFCLGADLICMLLLVKRNLIKSFYLYIKTIKWLPLFIILIYIYHPLYNSDSILKVEHLLKTGTGFANIYAKYSYDVMFVVIQMLGLIAIMLFSVIFLYADIKSTYKSLKNNTPTKKVSFKDIVAYIIGLAFIFTLVSGLYVKFFHLMNSSF